MIFQDFRLLQDRTVFDNVALPLVVAAAPGADIGKRARAALDKVGLLRRERAMPQELSAGEQQRVGIARGDRDPGRRSWSPTSPRATSTTELSWEIMDLFGQLNRVGVTLLIATHDVDLVRRMHYRTLTLRHGHLVEDTGPPLP